VQGTCDNITGCRGARLLVWLILNDRVQPSFIAGVEVCSLTAVACGQPQQLIRSLRAETGWLARNTHTHTHASLAPGAQECSERKTGGTPE
jgi:hypothetical protein